MATLPTPNPVTTASAANTASPASVPIGSPGRPGISGRHIAVELRRLVRNPATVIFTVIMPVAFYFLFGAGQSYSSQRLAHGTVGGLIMADMALYGAITAATIGGAMVALERTLGWSRQLLLTPLRPTAYIATKVMIALILSAVAIVAVYLAGLVGGAQLDAETIAKAVLLSWLGSSIFAAYGLAMGYLIPGGNGMSIAGPLLALLAFPGGLFSPLEEGSGLEVFGRFTPMYGVARCLRGLIMGETIPWYAVANILVWLILFLVLAWVGYRRDTERL